MWRSKCITHPVDGPRAIELCWISIWNEREEGKIVRLPSTTNTITYTFASVTLDRCFRWWKKNITSKKKKQQQQQQRQRNMPFKLKQKKSRLIKSTEGKKTTKTIKSPNETWKNMRINYMWVWIGLCHIIASSHEF